MDPNPTHAIKTRLSVYRDGKLVGVNRDTAARKKQWRIRNPGKSVSKRFVRFIDAAIARNRLDWKVVERRRAEYDARGQGGGDKVGNVRVTFPWDVTLKLRDIRDTSIFKDDEGTFMRLRNNDVTVIAEALGFVHTALLPPPGVPELPQPPPMR